MIWTNKKSGWIIWLSVFYFGEGAHAQSLFNADSFNIPLEAYAWFKADSFTLFGDTSAQKVMRIGQYESKIKITLDDFGEVYVHHVVPDRNIFPAEEIYSRKPSSQFIQGVNRYGNFRMYNHRNIQNDSSYSGKPKIEIVSGLNTISKAIYPLSVFNISEGQELKMVYNGEDISNSIRITTKEFGEYIDTVEYKRLQRWPVGDEVELFGWIQFEFEDNVIKLDLVLIDGNFGESDAMQGGFESVVLDSIGNIIGRLKGYGPLRFSTVTHDHKLAYVSTGGSMSEDYISPYTIKIYDLESGNIIFNRRSTEDEVFGWSIFNSSLGVILVKKAWGGPYAYIEMYVIDHDLNVVYPIHQHPLCSMPSQGTFYSTYCECYKEDGLLSKLEYKRDFKAISFSDFVKKRE